MMFSLKTPLRSGAGLLLGLVTVATTQAQPAGGTGMDSGSAVAAVVKVPKPWYAPKGLVISRMRDTIPQYQALPGLAYKAFSLAQADGQYGGIYLWKDAASAQQWFNEAWKERVVKTYGSAASIEWFDTPILLPSSMAGNQPAIPGL